MILIDEPVVLLEDSYDEKSILECMSNRVFPFLLEDLFDWLERYSCKTSQEGFVLFNGVINEFTDDVAKQSGIGLTELSNVEFVAIKRLDLLIVFL